MQHRELRAWHGQEIAPTALVSLPGAAAIALVGAVAVAWLVHGGAPARPPAPPAVAPAPAPAAPFAVVS